MQYLKEKSTYETEILYTAQAIGALQYMCLSVKIVCKLLKMSCRAVDLGFPRTYNMCEVSILWLYVSQKKNNQSSWNFLHVSRYRCPRRYVCECKNTCTLLKVSCREVDLGFPRTYNVCEVSIFWLQISQANHNQLTWNSLTCLSYRCPIAYVNELEDACKILKIYGRQVDRSFPICVKLLILFLE